LRDIGLLIRDHVRRFDQAFRYGGDEFAVIMPDCNIEEAAAMAQKLVDAAAVLSSGGEGGPKSGVSISCGVMAWRRGIRDFFPQADRCLNQARSAGRGRVVMVAARDGSDTES
jgi:diguanylate cyclase (GGDEF)-like protein